MSQQHWLRITAPSLALTFIAAVFPILATHANNPESHGFNPGDLDSTCKPCSDFYQYATGGWRSRNPVPASYADWGRFAELANKNEEVLYDILEAASRDRHAPSGSIDQKIGDFYGSCMNTGRVERQGVKPIQPEIDRIAAVSDQKSLQAEIARLQSIGVDAVFQFTSEPDFKNSSQVIGVVFQGGLGLPDRDYYFRDDSDSKRLRDEYVAHITKMFSLLGDAGDAATSEARAAMAIETQLAQVSATSEELRAPAANYHWTDAADLKSLTKEFSWAEYFREIGFPRVDAINVSQPKFFEQFDHMLGAASLDEWKAYLRWCLINAAAPLLSSRFLDEDFNFYDRTLQGVKDLEPRWKRCVSATDMNLGEALAQKYVEEKFPPEAKEAATRMVRNIVASLRADLETLNWMGPDTRQQALAKLDGMTLKIGYPEKWRDYSSLSVTRDSYAQNAFEGALFEFRRNLAQIGKPLDRTEWAITPPTVNAYYDPTMNEIVVPAGILQPPFFDPRADDSLNYGGIGAVIGHEMTHGFDDAGSQFDAQGNLRNWWTPQDHKNFEERAACIVQQFDGYIVQPGLSENGKLVEGESIADLGGLTIAYAAFEAQIEGENIGPIDGMTPDQRFFLAWARIWGDNMRPERERLLTNSDPHPVDRFRVNGPLSNLPEFASAFSCKDADPMVRPASVRCRIW